MCSRARGPFVTAALIFVSACNPERPFGPGMRTGLREIQNELEATKSFSEWSWSSPVSLPRWRPDIGQCKYTPSTQNFVCGSIVMGTVTVTYSLTLLSETGLPQSIFDRTRTAAVRSTTTFTGTSSVDGLDVALDGQETLTISGLLTGTHTVDGTSTMHLNGTVVTPGGSGGDATKASINATISTTISQLVLPLLLTADGAPPLFMSGTISVNNNTSVSGQPAAHSSALFTFDGSYDVVAIITRDGVAHTCPIQLLGASYSGCL